jgi:hypothetical protein
LRINRALTLAVVLICSAACGRKPPSASAAPATTHEHRAQHGGVLVELGDEFAHVELVLDPDTATLTAYVLDGEAEESVRLKQPSLSIAVETSSSTPPRFLELPAQASILTGETVGDSSEFAATAAWLRGTPRIKGRIVDIEVKGQEFRDVRF